MPALSLNKLPWTLELIERFEERWDFGGRKYNAGLSDNEHLPWSIELIERFAERWSWESLSRNKGLSWSLELIERFEKRWNWTELSKNESLPWTLELIEHFAGWWRWHMFPMNATQHLPTLRPEDIVAIMEHHFGTNIATLSQPMSTYPKHLEEYLKQFPPSEREKEREDLKRREELANKADESFEEIMYQVGVLKKKPEQK